jgi:hypothetical protein
MMIWWVTEWDLMLGCDFHNEVTATWPPVPAPMIPHIVGATMHWASNGGDYTPRTVIIEGRVHCPHMQDISSWIPHIPIPPWPPCVLVPLIMFTSESKILLGAFTVIANNKPAGLYPFQINCADPINMPTGFNLPTRLPTVWCGFSLLDLLASIVIGLVDVLISFAISQIVGKVLGKFFKSKVVQEILSGLIKKGLGLGIEDPVKALIQKLQEFASEKIGEFRSRPTPGQLAAAAAPAVPMLADFAHSVALGPGGALHTAVKAAVAEHPEAQHLSEAEREAIADESVAGAAAEMPPDQFRDHVEKTHGDDIRAAMEGLLEEEWVKQTAPKADLAALSEDLTRAAETLEEAMREFQGRGGTEQEAVDKLAQDIIRQAQVDPAAMEKLTRLAASLAAVVAAAAAAAGPGGLTGAAAALAAALIGGGAGGPAAPPGGAPIPGGQPGRAVPMPGGQPGAGAGPAAPGGVPGGAGAGGGPSPGAGGGATPPAGAGPAGPGGVAGPPGAGAGAAGPAAPPGAGAGGPSAPPGGAAPVPGGQPGAGAGAGAGAGPGGMTGPPGAGAGAPAGDTGPGLAVPGAGGGSAAAPGAPPGGAAPVPGAVTGPAAPGAAGPAGGAGPGLAVPGAAPPPGGLPGGAAGPGSPVIGGLVLVLLMQILEALGIRLADLLPPGETPTGIAPPGSTPAGTPPGAPPGGVA